jgi:hypothetical protein
MAEFYEAMAEGDLAFMGRAVPKKSEMVMIGTDPGEWFTEPEQMQSMMQGQYQAGISVKPGDGQPHCEGTVGWIADRVSFVLPDGTEVPARMTAVFRQEDGEWKMVQSHWSFGVPNEEAVGTHLEG